MSDDVARFRAPAAPGSMTLACLSSRGGLQPYLLYAFLRNFIERASVFDFEPVFVYNLKGCQIVAGGRSIA
jgi:hypothetical protein